MNEKPASGHGQVSAPSEHRVRWTLSPSWGIDGHVICDADPLHGRCRNYCAIAECENGCIAPHEHEQATQPTCNVKDWLEADDVGNFYKGPRVTPRDGYIKTWWDREGIAWEYDPPLPEVAPPSHNNGGSDA